MRRVAENAWAEFWQTWRQRVYMRYRTTVPIIIFNRWVANLPHKNNNRTRSGNRSMIQPKTNAGWAYLLNREIRCLTHAFRSLNSTYERTVSSKTSMKCTYCRLKLRKKWAIETPQKEETITRLALKAARCKVSRAMVRAGWLSPALSPGTSRQSLPNRRETRTICQS